MSDKNKSKTKILKEMFEKDPSLKVYAHRVRKKTMGIPMQTRRLRKLKPLKTSEELIKINKIPSGKDKKREKSTKEVNENKDKKYEITRKVPKDTRKVLVRCQDGEDFEKAINALEENMETSAIMVSVNDIEDYLREIEELEKKGVLKKEEKEENFQKVKDYKEFEEDVSWILDEIEKKAESEKEFESVILELQKNTGDISSLIYDKEKVPEDIKEYAEFIGVKAEDLYGALKEEGFNSFEDFLNAFKEMSNISDDEIDMDSFHIFAKTFVNSYLDRKKEEALLGLIGISTQSGGQEITTSYAKLLSEIFKPNIGGFFLTNTQNPNYNCFNIGNVIQEKLLELDEFERISYLENLLFLLKERENLLKYSKNFVENKLKNHYIIKLFKEKKKVIDLTIKYFCDLSLFKLGFIEPEELPADIIELYPSSMYEFLYYVKTPSNLVQKNSKIIYVFKKLYENDPLIFHYPY